MNKQTVLVTGATSFLGRHIVKALLEDGHTVYATVRKDSPRLETLSSFKNLRIITFSLGDSTENLAKQIASIDCCIHLAWAGTTEATRNDPSVHQKNVEDSLDLMKMTASCGCKRFIFAGSQAEYGIHKDLISESSSCNPVSEYGKYKYAFGVQAEALAKELQIDFVHPRIFSVYGPDDHPHTLISSCVRTFLAGEQMQMSACENWWNFLYIDDLADLFVKFVTFNGSLSSKGCIYNVAGTDTRVLKEFVMQVYALCGKKGTPVFGERPIKPEGVVQLQPNMTKTCETLRWKPKYSFEEGINAIILK